MTGKKHYVTELDAFFQTNDLERITYLLYHFFNEYKDTEYFKSSYDQLSAFERQELIKHAERFLNL